MHILNLNQAADRSGVTRRTLERLISLGEGPTLVRVSVGRVGVLESDLNDWIIAHRHPSPCMSSSKGAA